MQRVRSNASLFRFCSCHLSFSNTQVAFLQCGKPDGIFYHYSGSMVLSCRAAYADSKVNNLMLFHQTQQGLYISSMMQAY